jgi:hypothetical protein
VISWFLKPFAFTFYLYRYKEGLARFLEGAHAEELEVVVSHRPLLEARQGAGRRGASTAFGQRDVGGGGMSSARGGSGGDGWDGGGSGGGGVSFGGGGGTVSTWGSGGGGNGGGSGGSGGGNGGGSFLGGGGGVAGAWGGGGGNVGGGGPTTTQPAAAYQRPREAPHDDPHCKEFVEYVPMGAEGSISICKLCKKKSKTLKDLYSHANSIATCLQKMDR